MAFMEEKACAVSMVAGEDLLTGGDAGYQHHAVKIDGDGNAAVVDTDNEVPYGILSAPADEGETCSVVISGITSAVAGGDVVPGDLVRVSDAGRVVKAESAGDRPIGWARASASEGEIVGIDFRTMLPAVE